MCHATADRHLAARYFCASIAEYTRLKAEKMRALSSFQRGKGEHPLELLRLAILSFSKNQVLHMKRIVRRPL
jgi:hypothetical protein